MSSNKKLANYWSVGTAQDNGNVIIIRCRTELPATINKIDFPYLIAIAWSFTSTNGMPSQEDQSRMADFEDTITISVESTGNACFTIKVTGNYVCEWQFYAKDKERFMIQLNSALKGNPPLPIKISAQSDPDWSGYKRFANRSI